MVFDNTQESKFESPTKQLDLFPEEEYSYLSNNTVNNSINETLKSVEDFLSMDNKIFSNKDTELYLIDKNKVGNSIHANIVCKLVGLNNKESFFQLKVTVDMLKKYIYVDHKGTKGMEGIKVNMPFMIHNNEILTSLIDSNDEDFSKYHLVTKKPKDIIKKEVQENPEAKFSDSKFEINGNETTIYFKLDGYSFRVTQIKASKINQRNGGVDDETELIEFNKICLNNIGIYLDSNKKINGWTGFTSSKFKFYEFYRSEISKHIFNELNSYKYNEALEKSL